MPPRKKNLMIVGNGMATDRLLDELMARKAPERYELTVFGDEPLGAYNRIMLGKVLDGGEPDVIVTKPKSWYADRGIRLLCGMRVERLDTAARRLYVESGESYHYDVSVLATGSNPMVPAIDGMNGDDGALRPGVFVYRTMDDCMRIRSFSRAGDNAVVLGGGLLGLEAAKVLHDRGLHVTIVHLAHGLMNTQLDFVGGSMLRRQIENTGLFVRTGRTIDQIVGEVNVEGVVLDDGERLAADVVVISCGVRPRIEAARASKIPINKGILVNDTLATQVPGVYAIGECVEHQGMTYGLVAPAWEQAEVLADLLTGANPQARYRGSKLYARLKVAGVEVASLGTIEPVLDTDEVIQVVEERNHAYRKLIVRDRKLIGAQLVGNTLAAASLIQMFDRGEAMPADPLEALCAFSAGGGAAAGARTICNCNKVSEETIIDAIKLGAADVDLVGQQTRAGTGCGSCKSEIKTLVQLHAKKAALAATA
ncbi:MAG: Nitrite reductase large subunit [Myxococcaceae bacterium]|nr:Nitrite reductase large subunit [Myxococcaceae bacterium]